MKTKYIKILIFTLIIGGLSAIFLIAAAYIIYQLIVNPAQFNNL